MAEGSQNLQASSYKINKYVYVMYNMMNILNTSRSRSESLSHVQLFTTPWIVAH